SHNCQWFCLWSGYLCTKGRHKKGSTDYRLPGPWLKSGLSQGPRPLCGGNREERRFFYRVLEQFPARKGEFPKTKSGYCRDERSDHSSGIRRKGGKSCYCGYC